MNKSTSEPTKMPRKRKVAHESSDSRAHGGKKASATVNTPAKSDTSVDMEVGLPPPEKTSSLPAANVEVPPPRNVSRGLTTSMSTKQLKDGIWLRALLTADRFRVIRTIDVAVCCFPERQYKAALTAAQRAIRGIVKADLLRRYRTDRFQTVYGLTQRGVDFLDEAGHDASSSVRRVSDMTNPEHRLWAQFLVLCSEARGLRAMTEQELLRHLNQSTGADKPPIQGLLAVSWTRGKKMVFQHLRPDAVAYEADGLTWFEVDRSKRGSDREAALAALARSLGRAVKDGSELRRVVIFCKSERIQKRALAVLHGLASANNSEMLVNDRRHFNEVEPGIFEVWSARETKLQDGRTKLKDNLEGSVIVQLLPIWLPKVRIDATNTHSLEGWFGENYLPYRRPESLGEWKAPISPLLITQKPGINMKKFVETRMK